MNTHSITKGIIAEPTGFTMTILRDDRPIGKVIMNGKSENQHPVKGSIENIHIYSLKELEEQLILVAKDKNKCVTSGGSTHKKGRYAPASKLKGDEVSREAKNYSHDNTFFVIDNDAINGFEAVNTFSSHIPEFKTLGYITTKSSSYVNALKSGNTEDVLKNMHKNHTYLPFITDDKLKMYKYLEAVAIINKCYKIEEGSNGNKTIKTPIDLKLGDTQQPIYEKDIEPNIVHGDFGVYIPVPSDYDEVIAQAKEIANNEGVNNHNIGGASRGNEQVLIPDDRMLFKDGEEFMTVAAAKYARMSGEDPRFDCPFDGADCHSDGKGFGYGHITPNGIGLKCSGNEHPQLIGVNELSSQVVDSIETGYDEIYLDIVTGKYVFIKGNLIIKHERAKALLLLDNPKHANEFLRTVPKFAPEFNPTKEKHFINRNGVNTINTFTSSKYVLNSKNSVNEIPKNIKFLLQHLISHDETRNVFVNALANHLQNATSIHTGWIFKGIEGAGKGSLMNIIFKVFGEHNSQKSKLTNFTGDKVKGITEKLIGFVDESADSKIMYEVVENLKSILGNETYSSRGLFKDSEDVLNFTMYFFAVNSFGFKLSANDRRMNIIECNKLLKNEVEDLSKFHKDMENEIQDFTNYLVNFKVDRKLIFKIVDTEFRKKMIENNLPISERIARCILKNTLEPLEDTVDEDSLEYTLVEDRLELIHNYDRVQGSSIADIAKDIFNLTGINDDYYKKNAVTKILKEHWIYKPLKADGKTIKGYEINSDGVKTLTEEEIDHIAQKTGDFTK